MRSGAPSSIFLATTKAARRGSVSATGALLLPCGFGAFPASAQIGANISVATEDKFRGHSLSRRRPVAGLEVSYDDRRGIYIGGAATMVATADARIRPLTLELNAGYARRIGTRTTLDAGLIRSNRGRFANGGRATHYDEIYVGVIRGNFASHIYYSPDYLRARRSTVYIDLDAGRPLGSHWRLSAHGGVLLQFNRPLGKPNQYDWRLGITRQLGQIDVQAGITGGGPGPDFFVGERRARTSLVIGISHAF